MAKTKTTSSSTDFEQTFHKTDPAKVKVGDILAFVNYVQVQEVGSDASKQPGTKLKVKNVDTGEVINIEGKGLVENALSADFFQEEVPTSQSNLIDILMRSYNQPFTVVYEKQDGKERTLRGRLIKPDTRRGRSDVEDLDNEPKDRYRQADHRTLSTVVVGGTKYTQK